ncbi:hypothetical protein DIPPA_32829 [Diplonema papillatum]|nr:hypothetical protein DIPPA_32829 [Diplonema papillatum]
MPTFPEVERLTQHTLAGKELVGKVVADGTAGCSAITLHLKQGETVIRDVTAPICENMEAMVPGGGGTSCCVLTSVDLKLHPNAVEMLKKSLDEGEANSDYVFLHRLAEYIANENSAELATMPATDRSCYSKVIATGIQLANACKRDVVEVPATLDDLHLSEAVLSELEKAAAALEEQYAKEKKSGEFLAAERHLASLCQVLFDRFTLQLQRLSLIDVPENLERSLLEDAKGHKRDFDRELEHCSANLAGVQSDIKADVLALEATASSLDDAYRTEKTRIDRAEDTVTESLQENAEGIQAKTDAIRRLLKELNDLETDRAEMLRKLSDCEAEKRECKLKTDREKAEVAFHEACLRNLELKVQAARAVEDMLARSSDATVAKLEAKVEAGRAVIERTAHIERKRHYATYSALCERVGDKLATEQRRKEELETATEAAQWRQKISSMTLDPAGRAGVERFEKEVADRLSQTELEVARLQDHLGAIMDDAAPTEAYVAEMQRKEGVSVAQSPRVKVPGDLETWGLATADRRAESLAKTADVNAETKAAWRDGAAGRAPFREKEVTAADKQQQDQVLRRNRAQAYKRRFGRDLRRLDERTPTVLPHASPGVLPSPMIGGERMGGLPSSTSPYHALYNEGLYGGGSVSPVQAAQRHVLMSSQSGPSVPPAVVRSPVAAPVTQPQSPHGAQGLYAGGGVASPPHQQQQQQYRAGSVGGRSESAGPRGGSPSVSLASCEDLRKRAEALNKAALESRRRAQAHREQTPDLSSVSPSASARPRPIV